MHGYAKIGYAKKRERLMEKKLSAKREAYRKSKARDGTKRYGMSPRGYVLKTLLMQGSVPKYVFRLLPDKQRYYNSIKKMVLEGWAKEIVKEGYRFICLDNPSQWIEELPQDEFQDYINYYYNFVGCVNGEHSRLYSPDKQSIMRVYHTNYMRPYMSMSGIKTLLEERDEPYTPTAIKLVEPIFYSALEIKKWMWDEDEQLNKSTRDSRLSGVLFTTDESYLVYDIQDRFQKWYSYSEMRVAEKVKQFRKKKMEELKVDGDNPQKAELIKVKNKSRQAKQVIVYYKGDDLALKILNNEKERTRGNTDMRVGYMYVDYNFSAFYIIPLSIEGIWHTHEMTLPNWRIESHKRVGLTYDDTLKAKDVGIVCDGYKDGVFILNYCIPDLIRLKQFKGACVNRKNSSLFKVYCYPYQKPFLEMVFKGKAKIIEVEQPTFDRKE